MGRLDDRVAMVTGAASGIGAATATRLAAEGAKVLLTDIQDEPGQALAAKLGPNAAFRHTNVAKESDVAAAVAEAAERWGGLDVLHNNAGFIGVTGPLGETTDEDWNQTLAVLLSSVFYGIGSSTPPRPCAREAAAASSTPPRCAGSTPASAPTSTRWPSTGRSA